MKQLKQVLVDFQQNPNSAQGKLSTSDNDDLSRKYSCCDEKNFFQFQCPKKYRQASFENCDKRLIHAVNFGVRWAAKPCSVFLYGGPGTGKTYFAFSMIREMFRKCPQKLWPRYFTSTDLDSRLLSAVNEKKDREEIKYRKEEDLLFIDDIGRETKSDRYRRQIFEIINHRYSEELPTVLTSNYALDQLGEFLDGAVASRLQEWPSLHFKGSDMRVG